MLACFIFQSRIWQRLTGQSAWNIIPSYFMILPTAIYYGLLIIPISWILTKSFQKHMFLIMTATLATFPFLLGQRTIARTRYPKERRKARKFIGVANHTSSSDGNIIGFDNGNSLWTTIVKEKVMHIPPYSYFLDKGRGIPLKRKNKIPIYEAVRRSMEKADELLKAGYSVILFPEGTRLDDNTKAIGQLRDGAVKLAMENDTPIITFLLVWPKLFMPLHFKGWFCTGTVDVLENHTFFPADYSNRKVMNTNIQNTMEKDLIEHLKLKRFKFNFKKLSFRLKKIYFEAKSPDAV